jgi:hypothetical protein
LRLFQRMSGGELGVDSVCCLLHNLVPGGSGRQWLHLLARHVAAGGRATILAPPGPLAEPARVAGIEVVPCSWGDGGALDLELIGSTVGRHEFAVVHWDLGAMDAFEPALAACGRAALVLHQLPLAPAGWAGADVLPAIRLPIARALADPHAAVLVRGEWHRARVAEAFDLPGAELRVLPASIPLESIPFRPQLGEPREVLALMRLSPEKAAIARLAVEIVRRRLAVGRPCRLTIAGEGEWGERARELCAERLPAAAWRIEPAPRDPVARLAASDLVVAQGLTTLEAAALGRRTMVARSAAERAAAVVLTPARYDAAARDPFGRPSLTADPGRLWDEVVAVDGEDLRRLRELVEAGNSLGAAARALGEAIAATA